jgi:UrcA family protein
MSKAARVAASLAMAVAMLGPVATTAYAADRAGNGVDEYRLHVADIDFGTREGLAAYESRVNAFVHKVCVVETEPQGGHDVFLGDYASCVRDFRARADQNLKVQLAEIRRGAGVELASSK